MPADDEDTRVRRLRHKASVLGYRVRARRNEDYDLRFTLLDRRASEVGGPYTEAEVIAALEAIVRNSQ